MINITHLKSNIYPTGGGNLLKKYGVSFILFLFILMNIHSPVLGSIQVGIGTQLNDEQLAFDKAKINWWLTDHWALRGDYSWGTDELGAAALYKLNPASSAAAYIGLGENNISGNHLAGPTPAFIAGLELNLSQAGSGLSLMFEAGISPNDYQQTSPNNGPSARFSFSLNYRFPPPSHPEVTKTDRDTTLLLAKLITLESPNEPFEGKVAVAAVVLNRTRSHGFPDTIKAVIYEQKQFHTARKLAKTTPGQSAIKAAQMALQGSDPSHGALYFYNPDTCSARARRHIQNGNYRVTARIGNHVFLK
jgi:hypothetical protein